MVNFLVWIIVGGIIGWVASMIMRTNAQQGLLLNIVVGIVGAFVAGWILTPFLWDWHDQPEQLQHRCHAGVARGRRHPAGDRQPLSPGQGTLTTVTSERQRTIDFQARTPLTRSYTVVLRRYLKWIPITAERGHGADGRRSLLVGRLLGTLAGAKLLRAL